MLVVVAVARVYRGEHHPTDILASVLFAVLWQTAATLLVKPGQDGRDQAGRWRPGGAHRKTAGASRETASAAG